MDLEFTWLISNKDFNKLEDLSNKMDRLNDLVYKLHCEICQMMCDNDLDEKYPFVYSLSDTMVDVCKIRCDDISNIINEVTHYTRIRGGAKRVYQITKLL